MYYNEDKHNGGRNVLTASKQFNAGPIQTAQLRFSPL